MKIANNTQINSIKKIIQLLFDEDTFLNIDKKYSFYISEGGRQYFLIDKKNYDLTKAIEIINSCFSVGYPFLELINNEPNFDLGSINILNQTTKNKIIVSEKGKKLFLYGKDIFKESILQFSKSLHEGKYAIIQDSFENSIGIGKLIVSTDTFKKIKNSTVVVKNLIDIGLFLRIEK